jgi:hypothetical protein
MAYYIQQKSIRNQILEIVRERMADVATPQGFIRGENTGLLKSASLNGTWSSVGYVRLKVTAISSSQVEVAQWFEEAAPLPPIVYDITSPIPLPIQSFDITSRVYTPVATDLVLNINNNFPIIAGDELDIRFNNYPISIRDAIRFDRVQPARKYPYCVVLPINEILTKMISDRYECVLYVNFEVRLTKEQREYSDMEEVIAAVQDSFQRDHHLYGEDKINPLSWEIFITNITCFDTEYNPNWLGFILSTTIKYRTQERLSHVSRN